MDVFVKPVGVPPGEINPAVHVRDAEGVPSETSAGKDAQLGGRCDVFEPIELPRKPEPAVEFLEVVVPDPSVTSAVPPGPSSNVRRVVASISCQ